MKKFNRDQIRVLSGFWKDVEVAENKYWEAMVFIEEQAKHLLDIDIEVFHVDGLAVGFGDYERKYGLLQKEQLNKEEK